ncbi:MAG: hypothetical protein ACR2N0_10045 [Rubrobacteraceae bacterium]|nr:DUF2630 family protein [Rubrobacter sp.]
MAESVLSKIQELSEEREKILSREGSHHAEAGDHTRIGTIDHDLQVLWDLRRRELAGDRVNLAEDFYDRYDRYNG